MHCLQNPFATKEEYKDSWFDRFMVDYFAKQMSKQLGGAPGLPSPCCILTERDWGRATLYHPITAMSMVV